MKPFRKNLAIAIDGGGIKGVVVTTALTMLEEHLGYPLHKRAGLTAGTSTGSIIAAGIASKMEAKTLNKLYLDLGNQIFRQGLSTKLWPFFNHRYSQVPLKKSLDKYFEDKKVADLWNSKPPIDVVITTFDLVENRTRFIKPYKSKYADWKVVEAVLASAAAPTYFPSVEGSFIDGGVGSYNNPCYLAAYEIAFSLNWKLEETTLISVGTGRDPNTIKRGEADRFLPIQYINPLLNAFGYSATDQQVDLVKKLFPRLDFRRFQVDYESVTPMDDPAKVPELVRYGKQLGELILNDNVDRAMRVIPDRIPHLGGTTRQAFLKTSAPRGKTSKTQKSRASTSRRSASLARKH